jgi:phosphoserine phosphatase
MSRKFDAVVFDLDSTLVTIEGLLWLAAEQSSKDLPLFTASLDGKASLQKAFAAELSLLAPSYTDMLMLGRKYQESLVDDAKSVIDSLHLLGKEVWLLTNNFHPAIDIIASSLEIPHSRVFGSNLFFDQNGKYQGFDIHNPLVKNGGKAEVIKRHILPDMTVAFVGDAYPDLEAKSVVDLFIGFGGVISRPSIKSQAHVFVQEKSLSPILSLILEEDEMDLLTRHHGSPSNN